MATPANEGKPWAQFWRFATERSPGRAEFAFRLALICALTAVVAEVYTTPEPALTTYLAFFMCKPSRTSSVLLTIVITIIFSLIVGLLFFLANPLLASPAARVATMSLISFAMLFLVSASKLKPLGATIALILAAALDEFGSVPFGEAATRALLYVLLIVGIPAGVSVIVNLLFGPAPLRLAQQEFAERLREAAEAIRTSMRYISEGRSLLGEGDTEALTGLKLAHLEGELPKDELAVLQGGADCMVIMLSAVNFMLREPDALPPEATRNTIATRLLEVASAFEKGGYPTNVEPINPDEDLSELAHEAVEFFNRGLSQLGVRRPAPDAEKHKSGFFLPDAFSNPEHIRFALKTTTAAMFCYLTYSLLSWPGIHTAMITVFIVSLGTVAEAVEKLALRIIGCLIGAALGLLTMIYVIPTTSDIGHLAAIVFAGALLAAWLAAGSPRISYVGFQVAFAFFLCVIQGSGPSYDMVVARDRVLGILFGNLVSYIVATRLWPLSIRPRIEATIHAACAKLKNLATEGNPWARSRLGAEAHVLLTNANRDVLLAAYEPESVRPHSEWLSTRRQLIDAAQNLETPLYFSVEMGTEHQREEIARELEPDAKGEGPKEGATSGHREGLSDRHFLEASLQEFRRAAVRLSEVQEHA
jgi:multidrug resistance protein MdtO